MKILGLSIDSKILEPNSAVRARIRQYGQLVDRFDLVVLGKKKATIELSPSVRVFGVKKNPRFFSWLRLYCQAKRVLALERYDVLTVQDPYFLAMIGRFLAKKFQLGWEIQVHGFEKFYGLRKRLAYWTLSRADAVRTVGQRLKRQLIDQFGVAEEKITVVPIYSDLNKNQKPVARNTDKFIFLTVGRLVPVKNIKMQIEAMAQIVKVYPFVELWIVGEGPEGKNLKSKIENLKLSDKVKLLGWQDNLEQYYLQADAFLLTSNYEGWGLAVIEAASYFLPIIMTDVGCAGEVIKNNESGIVIPVGDKEKLVEAILALIKDKELGHRLGAAGRLAVENLPNKAESFLLYQESWNKALLNSRGKRE